jgi:hypothetical protein
VSLQPASAREALLWDLLDQELDSVERGGPPVTEAEWDVVGALYNGERVDWAQLQADLEGLCTCRPGDGSRCPREDECFLRWLGIR